MTLYFMTRFYDSFKIGLQRKAKRSVLCLGLIASGSLLFTPFNASAAASKQEVLNPSGGIAADDSDGLKWFIGDNSQFQVHLGGAGQVYGPGSTPTNGNLFNSIYLRVDRGTNATTKVYHDAANAGTNNRFQRISQTGISGSGTAESPWEVTTLLKPSAGDGDEGITITIRDRYTSPDLWLTRNVQITGMPDNGADIKLYQVFDTYLGGSDNGPGFTRTSSWNSSATPDYIGVSRDPRIQAIRHMPNNDTPMWDRFFTGQYSFPINLMCNGTSSGGSCLTGTGDLNNEVNANPSTDNGIAVQWNIPTASTQFTAEYQIGFSRSSTDLTKSFSPTLIRPSEISTLTFHLSNRSQSLQNGLGFVDSLPAGTQVAANPNIRTNCPSGAALGTTLPAAGSVNATPGSAMIEVSGFSIDAVVTMGSELTCNITVDVTGDSFGEYFNTSSNINDITKLANFVGNERLTIAPQLIANPESKIITQGVNDAIAVADVSFNDLLDNAAVNRSEVTLTQLISTNKGITLNTSTGAVHVSGGTPTGIYQLQYRICTLIIPSNCATTSVDITVISPPVNIISANTDIGKITGTGGITVVNVLINDTVGVLQATIGNVILSQIASSNSAVTLNTNTAEVSVASGTQNGSYFLLYKICDQANQNNCSDAYVTITIEDPLIPAPPDINDASYTTQLNTLISGNAGAGGQVPANAVFESTTPPAHGQLAIEPTTGAFTYIPTTGFTGVDSATVRVCLAAPNNTVCDDAALSFNIQSDGSVATPKPVPTLGEWSLLGLSSLIAIFGFCRLCRRQC